MIARNSRNNRLAFASILAIKFDVIDDARVMVFGPRDKWLVITNYFALAIKSTNVLMPRW